MADEIHSMIEIRPPGITVLETSAETEVDIVAVPAIGADPERTWADEKSGEPWLISESRKKLGNSRLIFFDHGAPDDQDDLETLAQHLLIHLRRRRNADSFQRPIFFICHSTGGLVAKTALVIDSMSDVPMILSNCHGIAFMATPHQGSSYLWAPEFARSIRHLMDIHKHIPDRLRNQFKPRHPWLWHLSNRFRSISEDMKIWTFLETTDSELKITDEETDSTLEIHVPITSIRSGLLDLEHEKEIPLATDHMGTAHFKGQESTTRRSFMKELRSAVSTAVKLSRSPDNQLEVEQQVKVQVNGFFEDTARGVSDETPLKLWSATPKLQDYLTKGPSACLEDRLKRIPGSLDDSSVSSVGRPSFSNADASHGETHPRSPDRLPVTGRPPLVRSRSSMGKAAPRILITEPTSRIPPEVQLGNSTWPADRHGNENAGNSLSRNSTASVHTTDTTASSQGSRAESSRNSHLGQAKFMTAISSRYKGFLPIPPSPSDQLNREAAEVPRAAPHFDRPEPGAEKLLWVHVPYTHTGWVPDILSKVCIDSEGQDLSGQLINGDNWYLNIIRARHLEPHARFVRPSCIHTRQTEATPSNTSLSDDQLVLYLPYLHWDTYYNVVRRRKIVEQRLQQGRSTPVPLDISKTEANLEAKLIWRYLGSEPPIHLRRTLDQFGYPNLRSTVARDDDQMLWKRTRKVMDLNDEVDDSNISQPRSRKPKPFTDGKIIMVDQMWLWIVDQKTVVTFFPSQEATTSEEKLYEQSNLHSSIYNELNGDLARRFETAGDLAALITLHAVTVLLDRTLHHDLQVLQIFEESISILTEWVTKSFKRFRSQGFIAKPTDHNKNSQGKLMSAEERDQRDRQITDENREDLSTLLELRDIIDELGTISKLLDQQTTTIKTMVTYHEEKSHGRMFIDAALLRLEEYRAQVSEMRDNACSAQKAVENLLDLKQKQANVDESRMARWQAEVTQNQSRSVMVFTVFTVIFLPLSFFTSLFGINVREWSGEATNLSMREMLAIAGPTSVAIIVTALLLAFSERLRESLLILQKIAVGLTRHLLLTPIAWGRSKESPADKDNPNAPRSKGRLKYFGGYGQSNRSQEEDVWRRHGDGVIPPLPSATESDIEFETRLLV